MYHLNTQVTSQATPVGRLGSGPRLVEGQEYGLVPVFKLVCFENIATLNGGNLRERFSLGGGGRVISGNICRSWVCPGIFPWTMP